MKKKVYVLGNPIFGIDNMPLKILHQLQKELPHIQFIPIDPTEEFPLDTTKDVILIDTVKGIKDVAKFTGLDYWACSPRISLHDFDLPVSLGLLEKLGKIESVTIIGLPARGNKKKIVDQVVRILTTI